MPNGCDANGRPSVRVTASVDGLMTLMVALCLLVTQISPFGAMARVRGAVPTVISASFALVTASKTLTESLSWLTTHRRSLAPARSSKAMLDDTAGRFAESGRCTVCTTVFVCGNPLSSIAVTVT